MLKKQDFVTIDTINEGVRVYVPIRWQAPPYGALTLNFNVAWSSGQALMLYLIIMDN